MVGRSDGVGRSTGFVSRVSFTTKKKGQAPFSAATQQTALKDEQIKADALAKVQRDQELEQAKKLRASRLEAASKNAELQGRALDVGIEQRRENVAREQARLAREARATRSRILSQAAGAGVTGASALKASQLGVSSGLSREQGQVTADERRNQIIDQIKRETIAADLASRQAENPEPINVFLKDKDNTGLPKITTEQTSEGTAVSLGLGTTGTAGSTGTKATRPGGRGIRGGAGKGITIESVSSFSDVPRRF